MVNNFCLLPSVLVRSFVFLDLAIGFPGTITACAQRSAYSIADQPRCYLDNIVEYK